MRVYVNNPLSLQEMKDNIWTGTANTSRYEWSCVKKYFQKV